MAILAERGQRLGRSAVQPGTPQHVQLVENRLAHERVRELEAQRVGRRPQQSSVKQLVERGLCRVGLQTGGRLQRARIELEAEDRGDRKQLVRVFAEAREPNADGVAHALRHLRRSRFGEAAEHLLDEEGVATGAVVHARGELVASEQRARERGDVVLGEPAQPDAVQCPVALEVGERAGQRAVAAELGVAVGADDLERAGTG